MFKILKKLLFVLLLFVISSCTSVRTEKKSENMDVSKVSNIVKLLSQTDSEPIVLKGENKNRMVVVAPKLVGRVMCCSFDGLEGKTNAFISEKQIRKGFSETGIGSWNCFGGEERIWFAPEGGKYGFYFSPGVEQNWDNYQMFEPMQSIQYKVIDKSKDGRSITFNSPVHLTNYQGTQFDFEVTRKIEVVHSCPFTNGLGDKVEFTGFESRTTAKNTGKVPWKKETSPISLWTVGIFNCTQDTILLFPFKKGPVSELGEPVTTEYFRYFLLDNKSMPDNYWEITDGCVLVKADGKVQTKFEMLKRRSLGRIASIDLKTFEMTIVDFDIYPELYYTASFFLPYNGDLLDGGVMSSFILKGEIGNPDKPAFYELETCSPIMELYPNEQFCHNSRTYHIRGDKDSIVKICERFYNVDLKTLKDFANK